jgi:hypothetical protein
MRKRDAVNHRPFLMRAYVRKDEPSALYIHPLWLPVVPLWSRRTPNSSLSYTGLNDSVYKLCSFQSFAQQTTEVSRLSTFTRTLYL